MSTILIADDNNINRKLLRVVLESEGYEVIPVSDGLEALDQLQKESIDLIITDILMPNLDGYNLCKQIRSKQEYDTIPIIIYSSTYTDDADKSLAFDLGADEFIRKPTSNQTIVDATVYHINQDRDGRKPIQATFEETQILRQYNQVLINKLEKKNKQLESKINKLKESESKFRMVVENINDVFFLIDIDNNKIEYVSPTYENVWGKSISTLYDEPRSLIDSMISDIDFKLSDLNNIEYGTTTEFQIENPDKGICWVRMQFYPIIENHSKNRKRLVCVARDITELRIMRKQYMQSQKMDSLGRLVGGIAHDFNNVLMVI